MTLYAGQQLHPLDASRGGVFFILYIFFSTLMHIWVPESLTLLFGGVALVASLLRIVYSSCGVRTAVLKSVVQKETLDEVHAVRFHRLNPRPQPSTASCFLYFVASVIRDPGSCSNDSTSSYEHHLLAYFAWRFFYSQVSKNYLRLFLAGVGYTCAGVCSPSFAVRSCIGEMIMKCRRRSVLSNGSRAGPAAFSGSP